LLAFHLLLKYENTIREEMNLLPDEDAASEADEFCEEGRRSYYVPPRRPRRRAPGAAAADIPFAHDFPEGDDEDENVF